MVNSIKASLRTKSTRAEADLHMQMVMFTRVTGLLASLKETVFLYSHLLEVCMMVPGVAVRDMDKAKKHSIQIKITPHMQDHLLKDKELVKALLSPILQVPPLILEILTTVSIMAKENSLKMVELSKEHSKMGNSAKARWYWQMAPGMKEASIISECTEKVPCISQMVMSSLEDSRMIRDMEWDIC